MTRMRRLALVALAISVPASLAACGAAKSAGDPTGVEWVLAEGAAGEADLGTAGITARFEDGRVSGFSGVNQYGGPYTADESGTFAAGPFTTTLMAGPEPLMKAEQVYIKLLEAADTYRVQGGKLILSTGEEDTLTFEEAPVVEVPGSAWVVTGYNNGKQAVVSVSADATLTVVFGEDDIVSGNAGVNTYTGPYELTGDAISIGPLASTRMAGPEALMTQETLFLAALEKATTWIITQGRLELRDDEGALQVNCSSSLK